MPRLRNASPIPLGSYCCCENSSDSDNLLVNEKDSEGQEAVVRG